MQVAGNSVVLVIAGSHLTEPSTHGRNRFITPVFELRFDCLELGHHPLLRRLASYDERSILPALPAVMRKAEKREGPRFSLSPLLSVLSGEPPKLDQRVFSAGHSQTNRRPSTMGLSGTVILSAADRATP